MKLLNLILCQKKIVAIGISPFLLEMDALEITYLMESFAQFLRPQNAILTLRDKKINEQFIKSQYQVLDMREII